MTGDRCETAGSEAAAPRFDAIVSTHLDVVFRVARSISPNVHDAEDLVEEISTAMSRCC